MIYAYKAVHLSGRSVKGRLEVENVLELESRLEAMELTLIYGRPQRHLWVHARIQPSDLVEMCMHMEHLERAGVPLLESLREVRDGTGNPKMRDVLSEIYKDVEGGKNLSEALARHPHYFDGVFVGLVSVGEKTGSLADIFAQLVIHIRWLEDVKAKTWKALRYPLFVSLVMALVVFVLLTKLVPEMAHFLTAFHHDLPFSTQMLLSVSEVLEAYGQGILILLLAVLGGAWFAFRTWPPCRQFLSHCLGLLPVIGNTRKTIVLARFSHYLSVLFKSGVDILPALRGAKAVVSDPSMAISIEGLIEKIQGGQSIAASMKGSPHFPSLVVRMVHMGETAGTLDQTLMHVKEYYERLMEKSLEKVIGLIEPCLLALVGGVLIWVIYAVFLPLYDSMTLLENY